MTAKIKKIKYSSNYKYKPKSVSKQAFARVYWPYLPVVLITALLLGLSGYSGALQTGLSNPVGRVLDYSTSMSVSGLLSNSNAQRSGSGVNGLSLNDKLNAAAQAKANDMATRNYWSHNTPEGEPPWIFVSAQGYAYQKLGENLAAGFENEGAVVNGWMSSAPHRENLINSAYSEVGFGFANNADYTSAGGGPMTIVVAFYGQPQTPPAIPNNVSTPSPATPAPQSIPASNSPAPSTASNKPPPAESKPEPSATQSEPQPIDTETLKPGGVTLSFRTSLAQLALADRPLSSLVTGLAIFVMFLAGGLWLGRHILTLRRVLVRGEKFAIKHPLLDIGLLIIVALCFLLSRTAGFIQ